MEMALVRFGRYVDEMEGQGQGRKYIELAKFLLDCRRDGSKYDQSHVPVITGAWADGSPFMAIPNYARANRENEGIPREAATSRDRRMLPVSSRVWIKEK